MPTEKLDPEDLKRDASPPEVEDEANGLESRLQPMASTAAYKTRRETEKKVSESRNTLGLALSCVWQSCENCLAI